MGISRTGVPADFPEAQLGRGDSKCSIPVAIGVSSDGYREIIGVAEGMKEDKESWHSFFVWLNERGLTGVRLIIGDRNLGMLGTIPEVYPDARC